MSKALATKNVATVLLTASLILGFAFSFATPAKASTTTDLQAQVQALLAQISALQGSSQSMQNAACHMFTQNLRKGSRGGEVMWIQQFLNSNSDTMVSVSGAGSKGNETSTFGPATMRAVVKFQNKYAADILTPVGLTKGTGNWGASTRAKANALCVGNPTTPGPTPTPGPVTGTLQVSAGAQPANSLAPQGAVRVPFTTFTLTNNSNVAQTINGVTVQRTGLAQDAVFAGVALVDSNGIQLGISKTLNSNHQAIVGDTFTIQPGQSMTLTVVGNMNTLLGIYAGQVAGLTVVGINTTATVSGSLPISGAMQTINGSLTVGNVTTNKGSFDPAGNQSKNIGDIGIKFSAVRFTAGSAEDLKLFSIRWRVNGSISASDLSNVVTVVDGVSYPAVVSADGRYYTVSIPGGLLIQKGFSKDVYVQGDITGSNASGRYVEFDIDKTSDVYFVGQLYGYGIAPVAGSDALNAGSGATASNHSTNITAVQPWFQGSTFQITGASITTIGKAIEVPAQNVAVNVTNQPLGGYVVDLKGESVSVQGHVFAVATGTAAVGLLTNVSIVDDNGAVVAGPVDATWVGTTETITFSDTVTYKTGRHVYTLKGKVPSTALNGATIALSSTPSSQFTNVTGQTSGNTISLTGNGLFTMNTMTVRAASLAINAGSAPAAQNIVAGGQGVTLGTVQLDASQSGEDIRISTIPVRLTLGGAAVVGSLSSCQIFDGATALNTGSNVPSTLNSGATPTSFTLDNSLLVAKGTTKTITIKCNVSSSAVALNTFQFGVNSADYGASAASGITSSNNVQPTVTIGNSGTQTIATGSLVASLDSSSPSYSIASGGTVGVVLGAIKFHPTNDAVNLQRVGLVLTSGSSDDLTQVTLWANGVQIGTASFASGSTHATSTLVTPLLLAKDADTVITVKGDLGLIGVGNLGTEGSVIKIDIDTNGTNTQGTGVNSSGTVNASGSTAVAGIRMYKTFPTFTYSTVGATLINGVNDLLTLVVTSDAKGPVTLNKLTFTLATTTVTLATPTFSGPNGNVASTTNVNLNAAGNTITVFFDSVSNTSDATVNGSRTYTLRGTVSGLTGSNSGSVSVALAADSAQAVIGNAATIGASYKMTWSPNATNTPTAVGSNDWTNAYGLTGCFATSGLGNDCTARVLSK